MSSSMLMARSSSRRCRRSNWRAVSSSSASSTRSSKGSGPASETLLMMDCVNLSVSRSFLRRSQQTRFFAELYTTILQSCNLSQAQSTIAWCEAQSASAYHC